MMLLFCRSHETVPASTPVSKHENHEVRWDIFGLVWFLLSFCNRHKLRASFEMNQSLVLVEALLKRKTIDYDFVQTMLLRCA